MERIVFTSLIALHLSSLAMPVGNAAVATRQELNHANAWSKTNFFASWPATKLPPFSFVYGNKASSELLKGWKLRISPETYRGAKREQLYIYTDPATGLELTCDVTRYKDFPAVEWVLHFSNTGRGATPILQEVRAVDTQFLSNGGQLVLRWALGGDNKPSDFAPVEQTLEPREQISLAPVGGCSSATTALPFFNIEAVEGEPKRGQDRNGRISADSLGGGGVMIALGWTGQWSANFVGERGAIHVQAGMERTRLRLMPGESFRTPRIVLLFWQGGDRLRGHNLLRSFIIAHHAPRPGGHLPIVPIAAMPWWQFDYGNKATENNQIEFASLYFKKKVPVDTLWLDAGWFEGGWPDGVGNWFVKKDAFPNGLRPLANAVHSMGMRFVVWFEPERVAAGTWLDRHHREWLLGRDKQKLLNLGNEEARRWLTDHISRMIEQEGIDIYRQDFSLNPLEYWRDADAPDRQGLSEIRYVEGLYEYWDELLRRHPNLMIDNGASGGRRIDLEAISRSVPLWRFDYFGGEMAAFQAHGVGLGLYVSLGSTGVPPTQNNPLAEIPDVYTARSAMSAGLPLTWDVRRPDFNETLARRIVREQKYIQKFYYGDFYPLTSITVNEEAWLAYQCDRPDLGEGMIMAFRRSKATEASLSVKLRGLKDDRTYELENVDAGTKQFATGKKLAENLCLKINTSPGSALLIYRERKWPIRK